ncbi:WG repeat-containing protein [Prevotella sp. E13-27]|uniref:WG repeat-containing protein n=1 Tax=Prevotella sp. E13-27 TaxID=2938122 RepID=UPI00200A0009|nr:WG repeat-containing protein [Prevotella sp. E13-27]MCK8621044.1 WG repeat-containing protein [Prevotella sp. E13-27]
MKTKTIQILLLLLVLCVPQNSYTQSVYHNEIPEMVFKYAGIDRVYRSRNTLYNWNGGVITKYLLYSFLGPYHDDLAFAQIGESFAFIDTKGKVVFDAIKYDGRIVQKVGKIGDFYEGLAAVRINGLFGFIDKQGVVQIPPKYVGVLAFQDGLAPAMNKNGKWGFIDRKGKTVIDFKYESVCTSFYEGFAGVKYKGEWGFLNKKTEKINPRMQGFESVKYFSEGMAAVRWNNSYGYIDLNGKRVIPSEFDEAYEFKGGLALVKKNNKWGVINKEGKIVLPIVYNEDDCLDIKYGIASVGSKDKTFFYFDRNGTAYHFKDVMSAFLKYAEDGDTLMQMRAASRYLLDGDFGNSKKWFQIAANKGNDNAKIMLLQWSKIESSVSTTLRGNVKTNNLANKGKSTTTQKRTALLIGNWDYYNYKKLRSPQTDVKNMYKILKQIGFDNPIVVRNANKTEMEESIRLFIEEAATADVALVYYSGHGFQINQDSYLLPYNYEEFPYNLINEKEIVAKLDRACVKSQDIIVKMDKIKCQNKFLIIDACRNNPFEGSKGADTGPLTVMKSEDNYGTCVYFATEEGAFAYDGGEGDASFFTKAFLEGLKKPGLGFSNLCDFINKQVIYESSKYKCKVQIPVVYGITPVKNFIFNNN